MTFNAFALCELGLEDISAKEIQELIGAKCKIQHGIVVFSAQPEQLALLCYKAQSLKRVALLVAEFKFKTLEDIEKETKKITFPIKKETKVIVECERTGDHSFRSVDVEQLISSMLKKQGATIDFDNPDTRIFVSINNNNAYIGIDHAGFDLAQREYKIFSHAASLKATIAYAAVRLSGYTPKKHMGSCFGKSGLITIEAALYASGKAVNFYRKDKLAFWKLPEFRDNEPTFPDTEPKQKLDIRELNPDFRNLNGARKNAKIAGVEKHIQFSHTPTDWLDVKFKEGELDILFAQPVAGETKYLREFFHQAEYILAEHGTIVMLSAKDDYADLAKEFNFTLKEQRKLIRGNGFVLIQVFEK
jgi:23S rRNA G2445 N2-methylase RlmL